MRLRWRRLLYGWRHRVAPAEPRGSRRTRFCRRWRVHVLRRGWNRCHLCGDGISAGPQHYGNLCHPCALEWINAPEVVMRKLFSATVEWIEIILAFIVIGLVALLGGVLYILVLLIVVPVGAVVSIVALLINRGKSEEEPMPTPTPFEPVESVERVWAVHLTQLERSVLAAAQRQHGLTMAEVTAMALRAHAADLGDCGDDELCHDPYADLRTEDLKLYTVHRGATTGGHDGDAREPRREGLRPAARREGVAGRPAERLLAQAL